jgi:hypothetical protein
MWTSELISHGGAARASSVRSSGEDPGPGASAVRTVWGPPNGFRQRRSADAGGSLRGVPLLPGPCGVAGGASPRGAGGTGTGPDITSGAPSGVTSESRRDIDPLSSRCVNLGLHTPYFSLAVIAQNGELSRQKPLLSFLRAKRHKPSDPTFPGARKVVCIVVCHKLPDFSLTGNIRPTTISTLVCGPILRPFRSRYCRLFRTGPHA